LSYSMLDRETDIDFDYSKSIVRGFAIGVGIVWLARGG